VTCRTHSALVGDVGLLQVAGEVDLCAAPALRHAFAGLFTDGARDVPGPDQGRRPRRRGGPGGSHEALVILRVANRRPDVEPAAHQLGHRRVADPTRGAVSSTDRTLIVRCLLGHAVVATGRLDPRNSAFWSLRGTPTNNTVKLGALIITRPVDPAAFQLPDVATAGRRPRLPADS